MKIINLCPHEVKLKSGEVFPTSGKVLRINSTVEKSGNGLTANIVYDQFCLINDLWGIDGELAGDIYIVSQVIALKLFSISQKWRDRIVFPWNVSKNEDGTFACERLARISQ